MVVLTTVLVMLVVAETPWRSRRINRRKENLLEDEKGSLGVIISVNLSCAHKHKELPAVVVSVQCNGRQDWK